MRLTARIGNLRTRIKSLEAEIRHPDWIQDIESKFCKWEPITSFVATDKPSIKWVRANCVDKIWKSTGVYAFAIFETAPYDLTFRFTENIKYIGQTKSKVSFWRGRFNTVRETLDGRATTSSGKTVHGGIIRIMHLYPDDLLKKLFVSVTDQPSMSDNQIKDLERYCFSAFMCLTKGKMPECSKQ